MVQVSIIFIVREDTLGDLVSRSIICPACSILDEESGTSRLVSPLGSDTWMQVNAVANARSVEINLVLETGGGGSGRHVLDLYQQLCGLGWHTHLILSNRRIDSLFAEEIAHLAPGDITFLNVRRSPHPSDLIAISQIRRLLSRPTRRKILHAHSTKAALLASMVGDVAGGKVFTPHAYRGMDPTLSGPSAKFIRAVEATLSSRFDRVIAVSPEEQQYVLSLGLPSERVSYIPNGVDRDQLRNRIFATSQQGDPLAEPVIGFVGRLVYQKNAELFVEMLKVLRERNVAFRALIVGDGALRPRLMEKASHYGLTPLIDWRGDTPAIEELHKMDVFVHTSRYESFPYTLLEVAAAEIPIVSLENSGSQAILGALLPSSIVPEATPEALATAVIQILDNPKLRESHIATLRAVSDRFTLKNMVRETIAVYEQVLVKS
jgi:glycosyltransferase involved in cell wall biosynthesis